MLTNGFTASTRDLDNATFLRGEALRLTGDSSAAVINQGSIVAREGDVVRQVARQVENHGQLQAPAGTVVLAAAAPGGEVLLARDGQGRLLVSIRPPLTSPLTPPRARRH